MKRIGAFCQGVEWPQIKYSEAMYFVRSGNRGQKVHKSGRSTATGTRTISIGTSTPTRFRIRTLGTLATRFSLATYFFSSDLSEVFIRSFRQPPVILPICSTFWPMLVNCLDEISLISQQS